MINKTTTAILVDGGFYRKRAMTFFGPKSPEMRADELYTYCLKHISDTDADDPRRLYRIFYYDCPPIDDVVYNPVLRANVNLRNQPTYQWAKSFYDFLTRKRKVALRLGRLSSASICYNLKQDALKDLCSGRRTVADLSGQDLHLHVEQKGVDMRIGIDLLHLAYKRLVDQVILITGDSDFVPAAKLARREGIDVILDPMRGRTSPDLREHVDGLRTHVPSLTFAQRTSTTIASAIP